VENPVYLYSNAPEFWLDFAICNKTLANTSNNIDIATPVDVTTVQDYVMVWNVIWLIIKNWVKRTLKLRVNYTLVLLLQLMCNICTLFWMQTIVCQAQMILTVLTKFIYLSRFTGTTSNQQREVIGQKCKLLMRNVEACIEINCSSVVRWHAVPLYHNNMIPRYLASNICSIGSNRSWSTIN
jgi:hypothetical protein